MGSKRGWRDAWVCWVARRLDPTYKLEAQYADELGHSRESLSDLLRSMGYNVEAKDAAQIMIYAWR